MKNMQKKVNKKNIYKMVGDIEKMLIKAESLADDYKVKRAKTKLDYISNLLEFLPYHNEEIESKISKFNSRISVALDKICIANN